MTYTYDCPHCGKTYKLQPVDEVMMETSALMQGEVSAVATCGQQCNTFILVAQKVTEDFVMFSSRHRSWREKTKAMAPVVLVATAPIINTHV